MMKESNLYNKVRSQVLFEKVSEEYFEILMTECELKHYRKHDRLDYFRTPDEGLLLFLHGTTEVFIESKDGLSVVLEILQEGEIIGFSNLAYFLGETNRPLERHNLEMEVIEDSYCLQIPYYVIEKLLHDVTVRDYILKKMSTRLGNIYSSLGEQVKLSDEWGESVPYVRRVQDLMQSPAITANKDALVQDIAAIMVEHSISSVIVVDDKGHLLGIVTEKDLVQRVLAHGLIGPLKANDIMTRNLHTTSPNDYYYEVLSAFYKYGVKHLPVIDDNLVVGVVTLSNLMSKRDRGSMSILKTIEEATFDNLPIVKDAIYDVLSNLINDEISTIHTLEIITKLYDRLARHCVKLAMKSLETQGLGGPPVTFAWYQMGSGARGEQFMLTDQDHFLIYADPKDEDNKRQVDKYFSSLGEEIVVFLEKAGYSRCEGLMMASEKKWRGSVTEWRNRIRSWAIKPTSDNILLGYNFLSFRFLYGDSSLNDRFKEMVQSQLKSSQTFLYNMALQEHSNPVPQLNQSFLTLFRVRGKREVIDIKLHALFPMHHCLQILGVHNDIINATPLQLLDALVEVKELSTGFANDLRHAYEVALRTRIQITWKKHLRGEAFTTEIKFSTIRRWEQDELRLMLETARSLQIHLLAKL